MSPLVERLVRLEEGARAVQRRAPPDRDGVGVRGCGTGRDQRRGAGVALVDVQPASRRCRRRRAARRSGRRPACRRSRRPRTRPRGGRCLRRAPARSGSWSRRSARTRPSRPGRCRRRQRLGRLEEDPAALLRDRRERGVVRPVAAAREPGRVAARALVHVEAEAGCTAAARKCRDTRRRCRRRPATPWSRRRPGSRPGRCRRTARVGRRSRRPGPMEMCVVVPPGAGRCRGSRRCRWLVSDSAVLKKTREPSIDAASKKAFGAPLPPLGPVDMCVVRRAGALVDVLGRIGVAAHELLLGGEPDPARRRACSRPRSPPPAHSCRPARSRPGSWCR